MGTPAALAPSARKRKAAAAVDVEADRIWTSLTRVIALTPETLAQRPVHVVTAKLDGLRAALACRGGVLSRIDALGRRELARDLPCRDFILDAEEHGLIYWVFDVLLADGRDVRAFSLADRLEMARKVLAAEPGKAADIRLQLKPYQSLRAAGTVARLLAQADEADAVDGLIFCDLTAPYECAPLKFKQRLTVDFRLQFSHDLPRQQQAFLLLTQQRGRLRPFVQRGVRAELFLTQQERVKLGLDERAEGIVECELPSGRHGRWRVHRLRPDRTQPNCMQTVLDTLTTQRRGLHEPAFLVRNVLPVGLQAAAEAWREGLRRRVLAAERGRAAASTRVLELDAAAEAVECTEGALQQALGAGGSIVLVAAFPTEPALGRLFDALQKWRLAHSESEGRLAVLLQMTAGGCCLADARFFRGLCNADPEVLEARAKLALGGGATLMSFQDPAPPPLLELPPLLQQLATDVKLLEAWSASSCQHA